MKNVLRNNQDVNTTTKEFVHLVTFLSNMIRADALLKDALRLSRKVVINATIPMWSQRTKLV